MYDKSILYKYDKGFFEHYMVTKFHGDPNRIIKLVHEDISNKENLLVTIGDSWTWGDSLGKINFEKGILDDPERITSLYGNQIKERLKDYDWINIAFPGTANGWIVDVALRFIKLSKNFKYKRIIIICTLTDMVRDFNANDIKCNFNNHSIVDYWKKVEKQRLTALSKLDNVHNIDLIIGRNFTHTYVPHKSIVKHHLEDEWVEVNRKYWNNNWPKLPFLIGYISDENMSDDKKKWCLETAFPSMEKMTEFLMSCPLHYKKHTKPPTEKSHALWASYITNYIHENIIRKEK